MKPKVEMCGERYAKKDKTCGKGGPPKTDIICVRRGSQQKKKFGGAGEKMKICGEGSAKFSPSLP